MPRRDDSHDDNVDSDQKSTQAVISAAPDTPISIPTEIDLAMCLLCNEKPLGSIFLLPCGHRATCPECAGVVKTCPIPNCAKKIESSVDLKDEA